MKEEKDDIIERDQRNLEVLRNQWDKSKEMETETDHTASSGLCSECRPYIRGFEEVMDFKLARDKCMHLVCAP